MEPRASGMLGKDSASCANPALGRCHFTRMQAIVNAPHFFPFLPSAKRNHLPSNTQQVAPTRGSFSRVSLCVHKGMYRDLKGCSVNLGFFFVPFISLQKPHRTHVYMRFLKSYFPHLTIPHGILSNSLGFDLICSF